MKMLAVIRKERGLTQTEVAKYLSIAPSTYCMYENRKISIPKVIAEKLATLLEIQIDKIFLCHIFIVNELDEVDIKELLS